MKDQADYPGFLFGLATGIVLGAFVVLGTAGCAGSVRQAAELAPPRETVIPDPRGGRPLPSWAPMNPAVLRHQADRCEQLRRRIGVKLLTCDS